MKGICYSNKYNYAGKSIGLKFITSQSELFRFIPISVSEPMRIFPKQSKKRFVSRLMKNGQKLIRFDPINSERSIRINPNQSEIKFSIQIDPNQSDLGFFQTEFSIRINLNRSDLGFIRIDFYRFASNEIQNIFSIGLK